VRHYDLRLVLSVSERNWTQAGFAGGSGAELAPATTLAAGTAQSQLEALSPVAILERGYALVFDSSGKLLKDSARVSAGDDVSARWRVVTSSQR